MDIEAYELRERVERVEDAEATENDLVTLAIPPDTPVGEALERVEEDRAEAEYIDEQGEDAAYLEALEALRRVLQHRDSTPDNGLVVYAGVVDGETVEYVFDDLPSPVSEFVYERDNEFDTDPLETCRTTSQTFGLLVVERGGAALGLSEGDDVEKIETFDSDVMGKTKAGGQSAQRFERDRERQKDEFFETVADEAKREFLGDHGEESDGADEGIDGLLVGGTEITVEDFRDGDHLDHRLEDALLGTFAVEYATEQGLRQLAEKASDQIRDAERDEMREVLDRFFDALHVGSADGDSAPDADETEVVYGREEVEEALSYDAVETVLVSADLPAETVREIRERADDEGGDCVVVSTDFARGEQFREGFDGVAAILRFAIE
ncbi:Vms1/Ankzf1 family peptidyl-tRNA hydrolase [Halorussus lipolyticus]|uniref:Vms1/Ankzf1 family peptidyl-tRNA hydrolase n=1 Tax=Halorussus lipolyticus TaxID=3034024 RepID=UPI0023E82E4F|nr:Vms1/Ankzf1 family peptidyl-tRNA hydrolase [Halorussus sp. DT80]